MYLIVGGEWGKFQILGKKPSSSFNYYKRIYIIIIVILIFFPHSVKQPSLGMELTRERKRKIESLSNRQTIKKPVHIGLKNIFIVSQRKASTGR